MKTITVLVLLTSVLHSYAQDRTAKAPDEKKTQIVRMSVDEPLPISIDDCVSRCVSVYCSCTAVGVKMSSVSPFNYSFTRKDLEKMPIIDLWDALTITPGVYQLRRGDGISIAGSRAYGSRYLGAWIK